MSTIYEILDPITETLGEFITKYNTSIDNLNTDKLEASDIAGKQNTLVSGTSIKTINSNSLLGSGDLSIPTLTDGDKGDITLSSSATVWSIDNDAVTNAKLANMVSGTIKGRTSVGTGDPEDMTATQTTALLDVATQSLKGLMSPTDKIKSDTLIRKGCMIQNYTDQAIAPITNTYVSFDTENMDSSTYFPGSGTEVTIQENGLYTMTGKLYFQDTGNGSTIRIQIIKVVGGALFQNTNTVSGSSGLVEVTGSYYLYSGDVIKVAAYHTGGSSGYIKGGEGNNYLSIFK